MEDALSRAEILAEASGVEVGKPNSIQELSYGGPVVKSEIWQGLNLQWMLECQSKPPVTWEQKLTYRSDLRLDNIGS